MNCLGLRVLASVIASYHVGLNSLLQIRAGRLFLEFNNKFCEYSAIVLVVKLLVTSRWSFYKNSGHKGTVLDLVWTSE